MVSTLADKIEQSKPRSSSDSLSLHQFVQEFWPTVESRPFRDNWHIRLICFFLEAITLRYIKRGIINIPPRFLKSMTVNVLWLPWVWGEKAGPNGTAEQWLFSSYGGDLVKRDSVKCRTVIESAQYQMRYPHVQLSSDQNEKLYYQNTANGYRSTTTVGGSGTGKGGDILVIDDPLKIEEAHQALARDEVIRWYDNVFSQRKNDPVESAILLIMQRLHGQDLTGHLIDLSDDWVCLRLPNEYEPEFKTIIFVDSEGEIRNFKKPLERLEKHEQAIANSMPRRKAGESIPEVLTRLKTNFVLLEDERSKGGELLFPDRFGQKQTQESKSTLQSSYFGQYQQRPTEITGNLFKSWWFRFWYYPHMPAPKPVEVRLPEEEGGRVVQCIQMPLPPTFDTLCQSWDPAFKDTVESSRVSGQVLAKAQANYFLLAEKTAHLNILGTIAGIRMFRTTHPEALAVYIEDKANGPAIVTMLQNEIEGLIAVDPEGGKIARANAIAPIVESGNFYLPHPSLAPWVIDYRDEWLAFPSTYTDRVDAGSQGLRKLSRKIAVQKDVRVYSFH